MATLVLSAAGAALGGGFGGSMLGLSGFALGRAAGATLGAAIDQRLLGLGAAPVETGRVERLRILGSAEGAALPRVFGRMRVAGQVIWSSRFLETATSDRVGGKGGGRTVRQYGYSISLAVALCEGEVLRVGRIWADGQAVPQSGLTWRLHQGGEDQLPDPLIEAVEGAGRASAYRGTAYVVIEDLDLAPYGNRIPQLNFEVFRRSEPGVGRPRHPALDIRGVALVPGTGEYALATEPVRLEPRRGQSVVMNVNNDRGLPDLPVSLDQMAEELPACRSVGLVVSWFGDDLRCDRCTLRPAVEQAGTDGEPMAWRVSGLGRGAAKVVSRLDGRPIFGGTPADASVIQAIRELRARGLEVMFYPFLLMDIQAGNGRDNPWAPGSEQPRVPWRGRITLSRAPGVAGSPDKSPDAAAEVAAFFGTADAGDFTAGAEGVGYAGPEEWSYRRFILHYAHLCAAAGGVDAFCIGSELRALTQIRDGAASYPAVAALAALAAEVRVILGPGVKLGYAADWSEYFGHQPADGSGDALYHLDPLWAHPAIDFVGIDNYMPLSDWRDGDGHADAAAGSIYDLGYLGGNVAGGEGYDWYYADAAGRAAQARLPIADGAYGEPWVFRYKDLVNWWSRPHENRLGGVKVGGATAWQPGSKPIWFTELGCPAVDKGTNQPNVFVDPKSSESLLPHHSSGARDDFIQARYLQAVFAHWADPDNNPVSEVYGGRMVDMDRAHVWAWDARPWPDFPARLETWSDGENHELGHWLNGRMSNAPLADVVAEIAGRAGLEAVEVAALEVAVTGYSLGAVESGRQSLQPLMMAYGFDAFARGDRLAFAPRHGRVAAGLDAERFAVERDEPRLALARGPQAETPGRVTLGFVRSDMDYRAGAAEAAAAEASEPQAAEASLGLVLREGEARAIAERWLGEARIARDTARFSLPPSRLDLTPGDVVALGEGDGRQDLYRIDRIDDRGPREISAVRIEPGIYARPVLRDRPVPASGIAAPARGYSVFLDLPLLRGDEVPHAPHMAVAKRPWSGPVAVYGSSEDNGYTLATELRRPATIGVTLDPLPAASPGRWMPASVRLRLDTGLIGSRPEADVLNGANAAALRFGSEGDWEVIQFARAELIAPEIYRLSGLLRGQAGTDGAMPDVWPEGTDFVLLDEAPVQLDLAASARGLDRHYRIGPSLQPYDDPSYEHRVEAFAGIGLRPYRPAHLGARREPDGSVRVAWIRRTRIDGDGWESEVPVGEDRLRFRLRVLAAGALLREVETAGSSYSYSAAEQGADGASGPIAFEVAQISDRFGPGPYERIIFDG